MISPDMDDAWRELLYGSYGNGIVSANGDIVETAISQLGNIGGQPFWSWYGFSKPCRVVRLLCQLVRGSERIYHSRRNTQVFPIVTAVLPGLKKRTCGRMAGMSLSPATLFSLTGTETVYPTM